MNQEEIKEMVEKFAETISQLESKAQIEILKDLKGVLSVRHSHELSSHEKRTAELKQLIQDIKSI